jgi:hypothetical protein
MNGSDLTKIPKYQKRSFSSALSSHDSHLLPPYPLSLLPLPTETSIDDQINPF